MDDARARLKDLDDRIQAAMDRHGITMAEICVRRFRQRVTDRMPDFAERFRELASELDKACFSAREMSEGLLALQKGMHRK